PAPAAHLPAGADWAVADPSADAAVNVESAAAGGPADVAHGPPGPPEVVEPETRRFARYFRMRNQIPEPLGELPEDDLRGRSHWFVFAYRGGRLVRFEHRNGADRPQPPRWDDDEWWGKATTLAPEYRADGRIARTAVQRCAGDAADRCVTLAVFLYSADLRKKSVVLSGSELPTWNESGISVFEYDLDGTGRPTAVRFRNAMGKPQPDRQGRIAVAMTYDDAGWVVEEREEIAGATDERPGGDKGGGRRVRVRRYKRDERRNPVEIAMFDKEGRPIRFTADTDWAGVHRVTTEWDERQRPVMYRFHGPSGDPARHEGGFVMRVTYDERGNAVRKEWLDLAGRPAPANKGAVVEEYEYDGRGLPLLRRLLGRGGLPLEPTIRMRWDESGNLAAHDLVDETLRGDDGRPIVVRSRVTEYDATGRRVALRVLDGSGRPVAPEGWAVVRYEYDERGSELLKRHEGLDGRPAAPTRGDFRGVSSVVSEHDEWGFLVARRHRGVGGEAVDGAAGVSDVEWKRDQAGRVLSERAVGASGTPAPNHDWPGSLRREYRYDADGNVIEERAFGPDGKPVAAPTGEHIVRRAYDHLGRVVEDLMLDADGSPVMGGPYRVARMTKTYAPLGPGGACWTDPTG
ncbi:MAG: hypothetical protein QME96_16085, partial [Myxococcota bacterium]|nr:hypothetical protein [Myxococcota bacterium]